jgi:hypothetical protein
MKQRRVYGGADSQDPQFWEGKAQITRTVLGDRDNGGDVGMKIGRFVRPRVDRIAHEGVVAILVENDFADSGRGARELRSIDFRHHHDILGLRAQSLRANNRGLVFKPGAAKARLHMHNRRGKAVAVQDIGLAVYFPDAAGGLIVVRAVKVDHPPDIAFSRTRIAVIRF